MTIELNREAIAQVAALPAVARAAEVGSGLIALWPLIEAMQMDNDAKYAENLQVRITRAFARILTGEDVTVPDAEFVYEGADEIPGRPQNIVDALLAANDAYDTMTGYAESGDAELIIEAANALGIDWDSETAESVKEAIAAVEAQVEADAEADGRLAASAEPADVAVRFATALAVCDALLGVVLGMPPILPVPLMVFRSMIQQTPQTVLPPVQPPKFCRFCSTSTNCASSARCRASA